ncbi:protein FANTASTIC FOUR 1 [Tripterygium wilfordii]|uniref:Protein FANTASTIC FOUR 1 n=1 Tax=Tripterygium wilfordii TaxID=458696 RepID=A0A7J7DKU6_TRIWF|nr:protein FANTASTIC FOUR 1-like [Tripterygium wilfordii]KAF5746985.1 protein FANTASTIC FOUR 1 [Tripterygium wilfordii]
MSSSSNYSSLALKWRRRRRRLLERKREQKKFPPPLSSLCENGQPSFFLRPVRKDGRLELTEVRIDRPSVFHAYREDGRLRLHIVSDINIHDDDVEEEEEMMEEEEEEEVKEEEQVVGGGEWRFEGFRRCHQNPQSSTPPP